MGRRVWGKERAMFGLFGTWARCDGGGLWSKVDSGALGWSGSVCVGVGDQVYNRSGSMRTSSICNTAFKRTTPTIIKILIPLGGRLRRRKKAAVMEKT